MSSASSPSKADTLAHVDGLRALAVVAVVLYHLEIPPFTGGFVGVDVFFVLSGYLITKLFVGRLIDGTLPFREFAARRMARLFPAYYAVLAFSAAMGVLFLSAGDNMELARGLWPAALFATNVDLLFADRSYFAPALEDNILLHTWSLGVEVQFYVLVALFALLVARTGTRRHVPSFGLILFAVSFVAAVLTTPVAASWTFYATPFRLWEFLVGAGVAAVEGRFPDRWRRGASLAGYALVLPPVFLLDASSAFPGLAAVPPVVGTALLILAREERGRTMLPVLSLAPVVFVGQLSYSIYLWHWPLLTLARWFSVFDLAVVKALLIAATAAVSWLSWRFVETPFRSPERARFRFARWHLAVTAGVVVWAVIVLGLHGFKSLIGEQRVFNAQVQTPFRQTCNLYIARRETLPAFDTCRVGPPEGAAPDLLFTGDSHGGHFHGMFERLGEAAGRQVFGLVRNGCPPLLGASTLPERDAARQCLGFTRDLLAAVRAEPRIGTVVLAGRWELLVEERGWTGDAARPDTLVRATREAQFAGLTAMIKALRDGGRRVVVVDQIPRRTNLRKHCFGPPGVTLFCVPPNRSAVPHYDAELTAALRPFATDPGVRRVNMDRYFCLDHGCVETDKLWRRYIDTNHINHPGARLLAEEVLAAGRAGDFR